MSQKILVADDDEGILGALTMVLEDEGYHLELVSNGEEIYKKVLSFKPDLILLDMLLSGSDGREICKKLKRDSKTKRIPIIMISAHPTAKSSSFVSGANDFLAKPFEREELLEKIHTFLSSAT